MKINWNMTGAKTEINIKKFFERENGINELVDLIGLFLDKETGDFKISNYDEISMVEKNDISLLGFSMGLYSFPTKELIDFLKEEIGTEERVLEIGAGSGIISKALNIRGTDSFAQQEDLNLLLTCLTLNQTPVQYGKNVEKMEAIDAIRRYKPKIVIASWVSHKMNLKNPYRGGYINGVKEEYILERVDKYIFIGNESVHKNKPIFKVKPPSRILKFPWLLSRSERKEENTIWIWEK
jgi:hypothetical protein